MTATMEIAASYRSPENCLPALTQFAKNITIALSLHLADLVASCWSGVLDRQAVLLFNESTVSLTLGNRDLGSSQCASREFLMLQATPAEFGWMARHCDVSMPVKLSEENWMLSLWFPFLKV